MPREVRYEQVLASPLCVLSLRSFSLSEVLEETLLLQFKKIWLASKSPLLVCNQQFSAGAMDDLSAKLKKLWKPKPKTFKGKGNVLGRAETVHIFCHTSEIAQTRCLSALKPRSCPFRPLHNRELLRETYQRKAHLFVSLFREQLTL